MKKIDQVTFEMILRHQRLYKLGISSPRLNKEIRESLASIPEMTKPKQVSRFSKALKNLKQNKQQIKFMNYD